MKKLFISYSRGNLDTALKFEQFLRGNGFSIWRDRHSIYGGQQWPKAIGEAIAANDAVLLLWSANSAESHFVEFEWNTALALKKPIIPCLLDESSLPPSLSAINSIPCQNFEEAAPNILQTLSTVAAPNRPEINYQVIAKLQEIKTTEPKQVVEEAKSLFSQSNLNVRGHVIQSGGDVHFTIKEESSKSSWLILAAAIILIAAVAITLSIIGKQSAQLSSGTPTPTPTTKLTGSVHDRDHNPIDGAEISIGELPDRPPVKTTSDGGFRIDGIPRREGESVRIFVFKEGYKRENYYVTLPGPMRLQLEKIR